MLSEIGYHCGHYHKVRVTADWEIKCHPACEASFRLNREKPELVAELAYFAQHCRPGMVLLDIGANFGLFSLAALHFGGETARVTAVDPAPTSIRLLRANLRLNRAADRVEVMQCAIGRKDGTLAMLTTGPAGDHYYIPAFKGRVDAVQAPQQTIESLIEQCHVVPTHVKIDVEGMEEDVLLGGTTFFSRHRPVIFLELHNAMIRRAGRDPSQVLQLLHEFGYTRLELNGNLVDRPQLLGSEIIRFICLPDNHAR